MDIRELCEQGLSVTEIARRTHRDRKTIRKWVRTQGLPKQQKRQRPSKLDPYKPFILEQMRRGVTNAAPMLRLLQRQGFDGKSRVQECATSESSAVSVVFVIEGGAHRADVLKELVFDLAGRLLFDPSTCCRQFEPDLAHPE